MFHYITRTNDIIAYMKAVRVRVTGKVQGVFYRVWVKRKATELGITGWVRNVDEGNVEMLFQGEKDAVDEMLQQCREGSRSASVVNVDVELVQADKAIEGFEILG